MALTLIGFRRRAETCAGQALDLLLAWGHDKQSQLQTPRLGVGGSSQTVAITP